MKDTWIPGPGEHYGHTWEHMSRHVVYMAASEMRGSRRVVSSDKDRVAAAWGLKVQPGVACNPYTFGMTLTCYLPLSHTNKLDVNGEDFLRFLHFLNDFMKQTSIPDAM